MFEDRAELEGDTFLERTREKQGRVNASPKMPSLGDRVRADTAGGSPVIDEMDIVSALIATAIIGGHAAWGATAGSGGAAAGASPNVGGLSPQALEALGSTGTAGAGPNVGGIAPQTLEALAGAESAPWWKSLLTKDNLKLAALAGPPLVDALHTSDAEAMEKEIFAARRERLTNMRRHAKGDFTPAERQRILDANEHIFDQIASNVASRGLSQSGVGQQLLAMAYQQPFVREQQMAASMIDAYELGTWNMTRQMMQEDEGIFDAMQKVFRLMVREEKEATADPRLEAVMESIKGLEDRVKILQQFE